MLSFKFGRFSPLARNTFTASILVSFVAAGSSIIALEDAKAQTTNHPFAGVWSFRTKTGEITPRERTETCLKEAAITHPDGRLVLWTRRNSNFSLDFSKPYFNAPTYSQCTIDGDNVETCRALGAEGNAKPDGQASKAKLSKLPNGSVLFCEFSAEKGRFESGTECAEMLACPPSVFKLKGRGWEIKFDIMQKASSVIRR